MTREEQIREASATTLLQINCDIHEAVIGAFQAGARWADKNPVNVWHDASEEPKLDQWFLAQIGDNAFDTFIMAMDKNKEWKEWSNGINIKRWAYISDLLPKGGEK